MKTVKVGLVGFGTIGNGVYHLIQKNSDIIALRTGLEIEIKTICDIDTQKVKQTVPGVNVTENWQDIIDDEEIQIVVELIGGIDPAKDIILSALEKNKNVVTANKKLLAEHVSEMFAETGKKIRKLRFEAAVGGGIPCILSLKEGFVANRIQSIMGILNGTTNYILSQMTDTGMSFNDALTEAQEQGFAESDPEFDLNGYDAGHKIALLAMLSFNRLIDLNSVQIEGINSLSEKDITYAAEMGYVIKLLGIAKDIDGLIDIRVHPTMLPAKHPLAAVHDEFNAVLFDCDMTGPVTFLGKGAGANPTASSVVSDIIQIIERDTIEESAITINGEADFLPRKDRIGRYYLRILTQDHPGILSKISGTIGEHGISIASFIQKDIDEEYIPLIIMTHEAPESEMISAIDDIKEFDFVYDDLMLIRVEEY